MQPEMAASSQNTSFVQPANDRLAVVQLRTTLSSPLIWLHGIEQRRGRTLERGQDRAAGGVCRLAPALLFRLVNLTGFTSSGMSAGLAPFWDAGGLILEKVRQKQACQDAFRARFCVLLGVRHQRPRSGASRALKRASSRTEP